MKEETTVIFKALSDTSRLRILKALQMRILCVCEIRELLGLANSTVSQHLSVLKDAGFIVEEKDGKWVNYMINSRSNDPRVISILTTLDFWINDNEIIDNDKKMLAKLDRKIICCS
jgi:ArsR family transcriptional regulator, arsenate/arsenite/antimonite-responsive transcriptional repressor